ncbi:MAG: hypothetical protein ABI360_10290 [Allobranchiibius sp.]
MRFNDSTDRKVVSLSNAETIGKISKFIVDVKSRKVSAVRLRKTDDKHREFLLWDSVSAFGDDAVTVAGPDVLEAGDERMQALSGKHHQLVGKLALSTGGDELGVVSDVEFDAASGMLEQIHYTGGAARGDALVGIGSYAAVIDVDAV